MHVKDPVMSKFIVGFCSFHTSTTKAHLSPLKVLENFVKCRRPRKYEGVVLLKQLAFFPPENMLGEFCFWDGQVGSF